jgi:hypothetical protein
VRRHAVEIDAREDGLEQVRLAAEILVEQRLGDAGALGEVAGGAGEADLGEIADGRVDDLLAPRLGREAAPPDEVRVRAMPSAMRPSAPFGTMRLKALDSAALRVVDHLTN